MNKEQIVYVDGKLHIKCGVVMLPVDASKLPNCTQGLIVKCIKSWTPIGDKPKEINKLSISKNWSKGVLDYYEAQHLYFTSDEEIKEGDWYIDDCNGIRQSVTSDKEYWEVRKDYKKIIACTNNSLKFGEDVPGIITFKSLPQPSQQFIEKYIEEYNKGNIITEVLVEVEEYATVKENTGWIYKGLTLKVDSVYLKDTHNGYGRNLKLSLIGTAFEETFIFNGEKGFKDAVIWEKDLIIFYKLKLDSQNQITIRKQKDSWTRNEVLVLITDLIQFIKTKHPEIKHPLAGVGVWIEEHL